ncbi:MAG: sodium:solute symporter [Oscillospiraceae bacterium]|jgi:SSS family solute:Na+ symporter|nr:sodium:solute symporter [Oscillospiraceae bacterium]
MSNAIKILMPIVFFAIMIYIGMRSRKRANSVNNFVLGGRNVGGWLTAFSYGTAYFSAVILVGYSGQFGWRFGLASSWIGIGNAVIGSLLAWLFLARRTRTMTQHLGSRTMPDFFEKRYKSGSLKIGSALIIFVFLLPYSASLYNGLSRLFGMAFNINYIWCIVIMTVFTAAYVIAGGYMATMITDFIQGLIMLVGIVLVIIASLSQFGGLGEAYSALSKVGEAGEFTSLFGPDALSLFFVVILTSLGTWSLPQMTQKFYAIKDNAAIKKGTIISTVFALIIAGGCYFLGGFGRLLDVDVNALGYDAIIPKMFESFSPALIGLVVIMVLAASMSTLSSLVLTASSTITLDLIKEKICTKMEEKRQVLTIRLLIAAFIILSAAIAIVQVKYKVSFIAQFMGLSWGAMAGAFLGPFLWGLYSKRVSVAAVWSSFLFAIGFMLFNLFCKSMLPAWLQSPIAAGAMVMLVSLVLVPLVSLFTRKPNKEQVAQVFACFDK